MTGKVEYLHMDFGSAATLGTNNQNATPIAVALNSHITNDIVRMGINYKFDPNADAPIYQPARSAAPDKLRIIVANPVKGPWTWTGYYLGINAGYGWGKSSTDAFFSDSAIPASFATSSTFVLKGEIFGVQTGYNSNSAAGCGASKRTFSSADSATIRCSSARAPSAIRGAVIASFDQDQAVEWFGTVRARFGAAVLPEALVYATGGAAVAGLVTAGDVFGYDPNDNPATIFLQEHHDQWRLDGWRRSRSPPVRRLDRQDRVPLRMKFLGSITTNINNQGVMTLTAGFNSRITDQLVRAGLNYKFD